MKGDAPIFPEDGNAGECHVGGAVVVTVGDNPTPSITRRNGDVDDGVANDLVARMFSTPHSSDDRSR